MLTLWAYDKTIKQTEDTLLFKILELVRFLNFLKEVHQCCVYLIKKYSVIWSFHEKTSFNTKRGKTFSVVIDGMSHTCSWTHSSIPHLFTYVLTVIISLGWWWIFQVVSQWGKDAIFWTNISVPLAEKTPVKHAPVPHLLFVSMPTIL